MKQNVETSSSTPAATAAPAEPFLLIFPLQADIILGDMARSKDTPWFVGIKQMIDEGHCMALTLPNGDRLIAGPTGLRSRTEEERVREAAEWGGFAVLKKSFDPTDPAAKTSFSGKDDAILAEVIGPAIIVGPAKDGDPRALTPAQTTVDEARRFIAFHQAGIMSALALLEKLLSSGEPEWDESVHDPELVEFRKTLSDEELFGPDACECPGCQEERERRVKAAGGSTAKN